MADQKRACSFCRKNQARLTVQGKYKGDFIIKHSTIVCANHGNLGSQCKKEPMLRIQSVIDKDNPLLEHNVSIGLNY